MPFDVTMAAVTQEIDVPEATVDGLFRFTHQQVPGGALVVSWGSSPTDLDVVLEDLPPAEYECTVSKTDAAAPGAFNQVGPLITKTVPIGVVAPPVDTTPPTVVIGNPSAGETMVGEIVWHFTVTDATGIALMEVRIDGGAPIDHTVPFDSTTLANGGHTVSCRAVDSAPAANETTVTHAFTVDNPVTAPLDIRILILEETLHDASLEVAYWLPVPASLKAEYAQPGKVSRWAGASQSQNNELASGNITEVVKLESRKDKSEAELHGELEAKWTDMADDLQDRAALEFRNTRWNGVAWAGF
jgi:hypothetical protein